MTNKPSIPEWLREKGILVTGATGFVGKVLIAKLLLTSPNGGNIYLLLREKKDVKPEARLQALIQEEPFRSIRENYPERLKRLIPISGDVTVAGLALSPADKDRLVNDVSVVFNLAANVKFDLPLRVAITTNTKSAVNLIEIAKQLRNLISLVHVSTAYCHCGQMCLEERSYPPTIPPEKLILMVDTMSDELLEPILPKLLGDQPNTYALSKCLSENLMARSGLPIGIARPSIVTASWKEPVPGWVDNLNGPMGITVAAGKGVLRSMHCNSEYLADIVPCDLVANAVIAFAWKVAMEDSKPPIFLNITESGRNPLQWGDSLEIGRQHVHANPFSGPLWYPGGGITSSKILHWLSAIFFHLIPAYLLDTLIMLTGNKPFLVRVYGRIKTGLRLLQYYTTKKWIFLNDGLRDLENRLHPKDREIFFMDTKDICWNDYLLDYVLGIRKYCLKDDPSTLPRARRVFTYLYIADRILRFVFLAALAWFLYLWIAPPLFQLKTA